MPPGGSPDAKARLLVDLQGPSTRFLARVAARLPVRHLDGQRVRSILVDRSTIFAFLVQDEKGIRGEVGTALRTNSPDLVHAHPAVLERARREALPAEQRFRALAKARGATS